MRPASRRGGKRWTWQSTSIARRALREAEQTRGVAAEDALLGAVGERQSAERRDVALHRRHARPVGAEECLAAHALEVGEVVEEALRREPGNLHVDVLPHPRQRVGG